MSPSSSARKAMRNIEYTIYGILYDDSLGERSVAVVAESSSEEAINELERALVEEKGYEYMKGKTNPEVIDSGFKSFKKGIVFGLDAFSNSLL